MELKTLTVGSKWIQRSLKLNFRFYHYLTVKDCNVYGRFNTIFNQLTNKGSEQDFNDVRLNHENTWDLSKDADEPFKLCMGVNKFLLTGSLHNTIYRSVPGEDVKYTINCYIKADEPFEYVRKRFIPYKYASYKYVGLRLIHNEFLDEIPTMELNELKNFFIEEGNYISVESELVNIELKYRNDKGLNF